MAVSRNIVFVACVALGLLIAPLVLALCPPARAADSDVDLCNHSLNDPDQGIPACTRLIDSERDAAIAPGLYNNRGVAKVRKGDLQGAIQDFTGALDRNPNFVDAYKNRGLARLIAGDFDGAIADYNQAIRLDGKSPALFNARGTALINKEEYDRAIADYDKAIKLDAKFAKAYYNRGQALYLKRQFDRAIADFDAFIRLSPNEAKGYVQRADARIAKADVDGAIADYDAAIRVDSGNGEAYSHRGEARRLQGDLQRSLADQDKAIELDDTAEAHVNRALAFSDQGKLNLAIADCDEAILLKPKYDLAYAQRGKFRRLNGDLEGAVSDLNKALALNPRSAVALDFRGDVYLAREEADRAMADFTEALRILPDFVPAYVGRGQAYEKKSAVAKAKADYEKALSLPTAGDAALARPAQELARVRLAALAAGEATAAKIVAGAAMKDATDARAKAEAEARAKAEAEKAAAALEARIKTEVEARTKVAADAERARLETQAAAEARARAEAEARAKADFEARARAEFEARVNAEVDARAKAIAEAAQAKAGALIPPAGNRVALVIGNSNYREVATLPNPQRDAEAVAVAFRKLGFQTVYAENDLTREKFLAALRAFEDKAETADWAVVYYAGHGIEIGGVNYLIPIDAKLRADRDVQDEAIPLGRVLQATEQAKKLRLVILDACRDNPFATRMKFTVASRSVSATRGFARVEPEGGTLVVYSARDGQVAQDGEGGHSPFTQAFLRNVVKPRLEINMLFRQVRDEVRAATNQRQEPFTYGSLPGEGFYFVAK